MILKKLAKKRVQISIFALYGESWIKIIFFFLFQWRLGLLSTSEVPSTSTQSTPIGSRSYLSKTIYEELITIMSEKVKSGIIKEAKAAKYYSKIVDSSPDISHVD